MRLLLLALFLQGLMGTGLVWAADDVQNFDGTGDIETPAFQLGGKWELEWSCKSSYDISLLSADGTLILTVGAAPKGDIFFPKGGSFKILVGSTDVSKLGWHVSIIDLRSSEEKAPTPDVAAGATSPTASTNTAEGTTPPATTNAAPTTSLPAGLTQDQAHAVVLIKGDVAEGTGFLVKTADGPTVVTNLHVISANPNLKILTATGEQIKTLALKGASDRDLAMFSIQDDHYTYLELASDIQNSVQPGDEVITPGNSEGGEVMLDTKGKLLGIGPERVEFDNPIYHGNSGGPVFHINSGKVLAVVTQALKVDTNNELDKASFDNKNSAITGAMRYFGLRLDTVPRWEPYDTNQFLAETIFLQKFHDQSRCLDSFLNGVHYEKAHLVSADEYGPPDSRYFLRNDKVLAARDSYRSQAANSDASERLDAARELTMTLEGLADADMNTIQHSGNFYSYDQVRAQYEIKYRKELRDEIESFGGKISDMGH